MTREGLRMLKITNPSVTRDRVWTAFRRTHDVRWRERYQAILLRLDGKTCQEKSLQIIPDRAAQHLGHAVDTAVREAVGRLTLMPQPVYSPELHPQERLWKWLRRIVTHTHWFATLQEKIQAIRDFFCYLAGRKAEVRRLCAIKTPDSLVASL
jgi:transposase